MTGVAPADLSQDAGGRRADIRRWRRRAGTVRLLRILLPALIAAIVLGLVGIVAYNTFRSAQPAAAAQDEVIRLVNPRFVGRDEEGRAFVITAASATRDAKDYQRVMLDRPALVLDENGPDQMRIGAARGVFHEGRLKLDLEGGVRLAGGQMAFETAVSQFDARTGELTGSGPIQGSGPLGEIRAKSYAVYGKGDRMVFKGGVQTRLDSN